MRAGGQTTVIRRVLERRAQQPPAIQDDTSSTIAVMLRCLPPPRALLAVGARLQQFLRRRVDWVARIGGEEFAVVLPETSYDPALDAARRLRAGVANKPFNIQGKQVDITASFGLCGLDRVPAGERKIPEHMLKVADEALYQSKHGGRNRVTATKLTDGPG